MLRPGRFSPAKDPIPIVLEAGWASGQVRTGAEKLAPTGIRSLNRPARSQSLYRLSYPGHVNLYNKRTGIPLIICPDECVYVNAIIEQWFLEVLLK